MRLRSERGIPMRKRPTMGFTLIELMIVVTIVAILATITLPSYRDAVRKTRRAEARSALMQLMQQQERYYTLHTRYIAFSRESTGADERQFKWYSGSSAKESAYEISGIACADEGIENCIQLVAEAGKPNVNASYTDPGCSSLSLTSTGAKSATGSASNCW
jgi:type IV pilus assembly protein PilE